MVRFVMVEAPMDHGVFHRHYRRLGDMGLMISMVDLVNCGLFATDILDSHAGRLWRDHTNNDNQVALAAEIKAIARAIHTAYAGILTKFNVKCRAVKYSDGLMVIEVHYIVDWNQLNCYTPAV